MFKQLKIGTMMQTEWKRFGFCVLVGLRALAPEEFELNRDTHAFFYAAPYGLLNMECAVLVPIDFY